MIAHAHPPEPAVAEQLLLQPLYERTSRLLGQLAGILLLATAGADPARLRAHIPVLREQHAAAHAAYRDLGPPRHLRETFRAIGAALGQIGAALAELDARPAPPRLMARLQAARRALRQGSRPALGIAPVDLASACCAGHALTFPPPLRGREREVGAAGAISLVAYPHPSPPPSRGRGKSCGLRGLS